MFNDMSTPTFKEVFGQIKHNISVMGIPKDNSRIKLRFHIIFVFLIIMLIEETSFFITRMSSENVLELTALAPCLGIGFLSIVKIVPIAKKRQTIFNLASTLDKLSTEILNDPGKLAVVKRDIHLLRSLVKYYFILNAILISVYNFVTPVFILYHYIFTKEVKYNLPYAVVVPFSTETWPTWTIVYLHSIICGFICTVYFTTVDALYFVLSSYVCSCFSVLSDEIKQLKPDTTVQMLNEIIKRHQHILHLADDLEDIFTLPNFFNVLVGSIEICALEFNIMIGNWSTIPGAVLFLCSVLLQIYMMSVFGEKLIRESTKIGDAVYLCKWYEMNARTKKSLFILIVRSQKPQRLTAYKFSVICFQGFTKIISTSWSYFTILRTVYASPDVKQLAN